MVDGVLDLFGAAGQGRKVRKPWTRERTCRKCGRVESVRKDNPADQCQPCAASANGSLAKGVTRVGREVVPCGGCSVQITRLVTQKRRQFCSPACKHLAMSVERKCLECDHIFRKPRSVVDGASNSSGNFCQRPCYVRWLCRTDHEPTRGHGWKHSRALAISRSPFCAVCGTRKRLQVHHIIPYRLTHDNSQENLVPLCVKHHRFVETIFVGLERLFGPDFGTLQLLLRLQIRERQLVTRARLVERLRAITGRTADPAGYAPANCLPPA
ncbi:MAG: endonuclease [Rubritepida sp.]|nr:endonuclease [Rubritepida sp.]